MSKDASSWCALVGEDRQSGVTGFGEYEAEAILDLFTNWNKKKCDRYPTKILVANRWQIIQHGEGSK